MRCYRSGIQYATDQNSYTLSRGEKGYPPSASRLMLVGVVVIIVECELCASADRTVTSHRIENLGRRMAEAALAAMRKREEDTGPTFHIGT